MMNSNENVRKEALSFRKWKKRRRTTVLLIAICSIILSAALCVAVGVSWFTKSESAADRDMKVTDFSAAAVMSINGGTSYSDHSNTTLIAKSNFANLRLNINYIGESDAYIRVKLFESFCDEDGVVITKSDVEYSVDSDWVFNEADGYYYYKEIAKGATEEAPLNIPFITGGASVPTEIREYSNTDGFKLDIIIEQVQPDRFAEFFGAEVGSVIG